MGSIRGGCVLSAGAGVGRGMGAGAVTGAVVASLDGSAGGAVIAAGVAATCRAADAAVITAALGKADGERAAVGAGLAPSVIAGKELPHLGQNLACGLQTAWHCGQFFSVAAEAGAAVTAASATVLGRFCLDPQRLQNLALAASALPH